MNQYNSINSNAFKQILVILSIRPCIGHFVKEWRVIAADHGNSAIMRRAERAPRPDVGAIRIHQMGLRNQQSDFVDNKNAELRFLGSFDIPGVDIIVIAASGITPEIGIVTAAVDQVDNGFPRAGVFLITERFCRETVHFHLFPVSSMPEPG